jgi:hypothetical protein
VNRAQHLPARRLISEAVPVADTLANAIMLHSLYHVFEAASHSGAPA